MNWRQPDVNEQKLFADINLNSDFGRLCLALATAIRIEPLLLRNARVKFCPRSDASLENQFWFSSIIRTRSARSVSMYPGVAKLLIENDPQFSENKQFVNRHTRHWSFEDRIEQELRNDAINPDNNKDNIKVKLQQIIRKAYDLQNARTDNRVSESEYELARWIKETLPTMSFTDYVEDEKLLLHHYAATLLGDSQGNLLTNKSTDIFLPTWFRTSLFSEKITKLRIGLSKGVLCCFPSDSPEGHLVESASQLPIPVVIKYNDLPSDPPLKERLWPGHIIRINELTRNLSIVTPAGERYTIKYTGPSITEDTNSSSLATQYQLVIEYMEEDLEFAHAIKNTLKENNIDADLNRLRPNESNWRSMANQANVFAIQLWTPNTEIAFRDSQSELPSRNFLQTLLIRTNKEIALPPGLSDSQVLDFSNFQGKSGRGEANKLVETLQVFLANKPLPKKDPIDDTKAPGQTQVSDDNEVEKNRRGHAEIKLFVSHRSRTYQSLALLKEVCDALDKLGFNVFADQKLSSGEDWNYYLTEWIAECDAAVILFSRDALEQSEWLWKEFTLLSWRKGIEPKFNLIGVLLDDIAIEELKKNFFNLFRIDDIQFIHDTDNGPRIVSKISKSLVNLKFETRSSPLQQLAIYCNEILNQVDKDALHDIWDSLTSKENSMWLPEMNIGEILTRYLWRNPKRALTDLIELLQRIRPKLRYEAAKRLVNLFKGFWIPLETSAALAVMRDMRVNVAMNGNLKFPRNYENRIFDIFQQRIFLHLITKGYINVVFFGFSELLFLLQKNTPLNYNN